MTLKDMSSVGLSYLVIANIFLFSIYRIATIVLIQPYFISLLLWFPWQRLMTSRHLLLAPPWCLTVDALVGTL